jgi:DNA-binding NarL/FixJ family response regulator
VKVLLVTGRRIVRKEVRECLRRSSYRMAVSSYERALTAVQARRPPIAVVVDATDRPEDALELIRKLKREAPAVKIVAAITPFPEGGTPWGLLAIEAEAFTFIPGAHNIQSTLLSVIGLSLTGEE